MDVVSPFVASNSENGFELIYAIVEAEVCAVGSVEKASVDSSSPSLRPIGDRTGPPCRDNGPHTGMVVRRRIKA